MRVPASVVALLCAALCACGEAALSRGAEFYMQGCYIDAAQVFEHAEGGLASYGAEDRARYGLYRGATLFALGYTDSARHWLSYSSASATSSLSSSERLTLIESFLSSTPAQQSGTSPTGGVSTTGMSSLSTFPTAAASRAGKTAP